MFNISSFLGKLSKNLVDLNENKRKVLEIINNKTQIALSEADLEFKNYTLQIKGSPSVKNKLFVFKKEIIEEVEKATGLKIVDIK